MLGQKVIRKKIAAVTIVFLLVLQIIVSIVFAPFEVSTIGIIALLVALYFCTKKEVPN